MTAKPTTKVATQKTRQRNKTNATETKDNSQEQRVESFQTLLNHLATICRNDC
jgi:hypothetical protein